MNVLVVAVVLVSESELTENQKTNTTPMLLHGKYSCLFHLTILFFYKENNNSGSILVMTGAFDPYMVRPP